MFGSSVLEVAIGIIFFYLLMSLVTTSLHEAFSSLINKRGKNLFEGIKNLLNDPKFTGLAQQLYAHGLVDGISQNATNPQKANRLPSYMGASTFSLALIDILGSRGIGESWSDVVIQRQKELDAFKAKRDATPTDVALQKSVDDAQMKLDAAREKVAQAEDAKQKHETADAAALLVKGLNDLDKIQDASVKLEAALAAGRALAAQHPDPLGNFRKAVESLPSGHTKESLLVMVDKTRREIATVSNQLTTVEHHIEKLQENIEQWFDGAMDRVSGWYKRWTQKILLGIVVVVVAFANADTLMLAKRLIRDNALRSSVVVAADKASRGSDPAASDAARQGLLMQAEKLDLPIGWVAEANVNPTNEAKQLPSNLYAWILKILGLLITVFAVSLGAPFWFDTLSKFVNLRGAGTPPGEPKKSAPRVAG